MAAADPDLEWESIPGVVVELDVLWRSWAHAWSGAGSLYDRREWLDYLPRAVDHMARLVAGWNESAGMESSRAACSLATSGAGSLGLVPGALRWANTKPSRAAGALLRWRGRSRCLARRCIGLWRLFTIEGGRWGLNPSASSSKRTVSWVGLRKSKALPQRCSSRQLMLWWGREGACQRMLGGGSCADTGW